MPQVTVPHLYSPRPYQLPILRAWDSGYKRLILCAHRRSGKDKTIFANLPKKMIQRVGLYLYVLPYYSQAKKIIWQGSDKEGFRFLNHFPKEIIKNLNETEMRVELINGSILQLVGADRVDSIVGTNPIGVVFSEYSLMKPNVWDFIRPILAENGGWAVFIFTPRGMNHAWKLIQQARGNAEWFIQTLTVDDTNAIPKETLEAEKREMPQDLFEQEYYVKFIEGAGAFFRNVDSNRALTDPTPDPQRKYRMGVDLAKFQDYTVITVIDLMSFNVVKQERFNQIDYTLQKAKIEAMYHKYYKPLVYIDSTGVGEPIYDDLAKAGMNIQPFHFTEQSRKDLLVNLQLRLEQGTLKIPDDEILLSELKSFQYTITDSGRVKIQVPEGVHDDCFVAGTKILTGRGQVPIEDVKVGDLVKTRMGYMPVEMTRNRYKKVITDLGLTGTPTHPIITKRGDIPFGKVEDNDTIYIWNEKQYCIEEKSITAIRHHLADNSEFTTGDTINGKSLLWRTIDSFGLTITETFQRTTSFITKTVIRSITRLRTWNCCTEACTQNSICSNQSVGNNQGEQDLHRLNEEQKHLKDSEQAQKERNTTETMLHEAYILRSHKKGFVKTVRASFHSYANKVLTFVENCARHVSGERRVYNLQVSNQHEYFANNILVHNCVFSLALAAWELPQNPLPRQGSLRQIGDMQQRREQTSFE